MPDRGTPDIITAMPGARLTSFTFGAIAERLAEYILGTMSFTTPVPYQDDIGHDFHCVLKTQSDDGRMTLAGPSFSVQVKSDHEPLVYEKPYEREWIGAQQDPFFVCVVERAESRCSIYSTWNVHNAFQHFGLGLDPGSRTRTVKLVPAKWMGEWVGLLTIQSPADKNGVLEIPLGPPVLQLTPAAVKDPSDAREYAKILKAWIELERANIVRESMGMYWVYGPSSWAPNELPNLVDQAGGFYVNVKNLYPTHGGSSLGNFIKSTVALAAVLGEHHVNSVPLPQEATPQLMALLDGLVEHLAPNMDQIEQAALINYRLWRASTPPST